MNLRASDVVCSTPLLQSLHLQKWSAAEQRTLSWYLVSGRNAFSWAVYVEDFRPGTETLCCSKFTEIDMIHVYFFS